MTTVAASSLRQGTLRRALTPARLRVLFALAGGLFVLNLASATFGQAPLAVLAQAFHGTWGTPYGVGQVLLKATPLVFTGLSFHVALRVGLFNIGSEGQLALASLGAAVFASKLGPGIPAVVAVPLVLACAMALGGSVAYVTGALRARLGVHEIISGIMLNRIIDVAAPWLLVAVLGAVSLRTEPIAASARLPRLDTLAPSLSGSAASFAAPLALLVVFATFAWLDRSRAGREMAWIGKSESVCAAQGIDVPARRTQAMVLSGALAALAMSGTVLGYKGAHELGLGAGAGFSGIAVAMVGRTSPVALVLAALLFGTLAQAGLAINAAVPREAMGVVEAVVILLVAAVASAGEPPASASAAPRAPRAPQAPQGEPPNRAEETP